MEFNEVLREFIEAIEKQSGIGDGIVKIALTPELFDYVVIELSKKQYGRVWPGITDLGELKIYNVQIVARNRDNF